jgi:UDP-N-acetylmuramoyl-tripeptide--D-alanyl-D-alanine ligase
MHTVLAALRDYVRGAGAPTAAELLPTVEAALKPGDAVMVKGSNGSKAGLIAKALIGTRDT